MVACNTLVTRADVHISLAFVGLTAKTVVSPTDSVRLLSHMLIAEDSTVQVNVTAFGWGAIQPFEK